MSRQTASLFFVTNTANYSQLSLALKVGEEYNDVYKHFFLKGGYMPLTKTPGARIWVRFSNENYEMFDKWSRELNIPTSQLISLCAVTGSRVVIPTLLPDAREALEMIAKKEEQERYQEMADAYFEASKEEFEGKVDET